MKKRQLKKRLAVNNPVFALSYIGLVAMFAVALSNNQSSIKEFIFIGGLVAYTIGELTLLFMYSKVYRICSKSEGKIPLIADETLGDTNIYYSEKGTIKFDRFKGYFNISLSRKILSKTLSLFIIAIMAYRIWCLMNLRHFNEELLSAPAIILTIKFLLILTPKNK